MEVLTEIPVRKITSSKINEVDFNHLEFGKHVSDHMLVCDYKNGNWQTPQIMPYANLSLSPTALALHYGQTVFEGMKAFKMEDGSINIFRVDKHYERFVKSLERMCMTVIPKEIFVDGLFQLIWLDKNWVPASPSSLYIRPFMFASEAKFGVKVSDEYRFIIFSGPVPALYTKPIKVKVETEFVRAAKGGTGSAKCGGNYGAAFLPAKKAKEEGFDQVLWTDSKENKYIEESGMMNAMFVINDVVVTPPLSDSILDGVTRDSLLTIAKTLGYKIEERKVSVQELKDAISNGSITEVFGVGTAALISPVSVVGIEGKEYALPSYTSDNIMFKLKNKLDNIRHGAAPDIYNWNFIIDEIN